MTQTSRTPDPVVGIYAQPDDVTVASVDRVRWGAVIAGLFAAISVLIVLAVAGLAVGLSTFAPGTNAGSVLVGTGIWGAISVLIAFFVGGGTAARSAAVHGHGNGTLNGAMVWLVAIPLLLYTLIGGVGSLLNTVTGTAATAAQVAAPVAGQAAAAAATTVNGTPGIQQTVQTAGTQVAPTVQAAAQAAATAISNVPAQDVKNATNSIASTALGVLLWLGLGLLAATLGGYVGSRSTNVLVARGAPATR